MYQQPADSLVIYCFSSPLTKIIWSIKRVSSKSQGSDTRDGSTSVCPGRPPGDRDLPAVPHPAMKERLSIVLALFIPTYMGHTVAMPLKMDTKLDNNLVADGHSAPLYYIDPDTSLDTSLMEASNHEDTTTGEKGSNLCDEGLDSKSDLDSNTNPNNTTDPALLDELTSSYPWAMRSIMRILISPFTSTMTETEVSTMTRTYSLLFWSIILITAVFFTWAITFCTYECYPTTNSRTTHHWPERTPEDLNPVRKPADMTYPELTIEILKNIRIYIKNHLPACFTDSTNQPATVAREPVSFIEQTNDSAKEVQEVPGQLTNQANRTWRPIRGLQIVPNASATDVGRTPGVTHPDTPFYDGEYIEVDDTRLGYIELHICTEDEEDSIETYEENYEDFGHCYEPALKVDGM